MGAPRDVTATGGQGRFPPPGLLTPWTGQGAWDGRVDLAVRMAGGLRDHLRGLQLMHMLAAHNSLAALRRIAVPLFLLIAILLASGRAHAASCASYSDECTEGAAKSGALAWVYKGPACDAKDLDPTEVTVYRAGTTRGYYNPRAYCRTGGGYYVSPTSGQQLAWYFTRGCGGESTYTGVGPWGTGGAARNGSLGCRNGCDGVWQSNTDSSKTWTPTGSTCPENEEQTCNRYGDGYYWNAALKVCEPPEGKCPGGRPVNSLGQCAPEPCPEGMAQQADGTCKKKENECPAGQIRSPDGKCLPGDGQCAKGEVRGQDGTCKKDADDDGNPDPVTDESFSGGDDCSAPPSCSGSPIMCGQARIQWRIDCNTRKNRNIAGGTCASMPICTGEKCDALEYAGLLMQWRSACALEKMAQGNGNGGGDNGDTKAIRDALTGTGGSVTTAPDRPSSDVWAPRSGTPVKPDTGGYGWGRTCPQPPSFEVFGNVIQINTAPLCNWLILGGYFVMGLAALASLRIIASRDA